MDNIDDFQFRPITEGLGFHKQNEVKQKKNLTETLSETFTSGRTLKPTVAPERIKERPKSAVQNKTQINYQIADPVMGAVFDPAPYKKKAATPTVTNENRVSILPAAILFDAVVVTGLACLFIFAVLLVAKVDPIAVFYMMNKDRMTLLSLAVLIFSILQMYTIISRSFFGSTMGEWAFESELGTKEQQESVSYPLKVAGRSFITMICGFVTLPLISAILGTDLAGRISGLYLYRS